MLDNLVLNTLKSRRGRLGKADGAHDARGRCTVEVKDSGIGIPREEIGQLFTRFYRASTATHHAIPGPAWDW